MATELQKRAINIKIKKLLEKQPIIMGEIMLEAGYSKKAAEYPKRLIESKGWQGLLEEINDKEILDKIKDILKDNDKRSSLTAADMLLKLKDRYPATKSKIIGLFDKIGELEKSGEKEEEIIDNPSLPID